MSNITIKIYFKQVDFNQANHLNFSNKSNLAKTNSTVSKSSHQSDHGPMIITPGSYGLERKFNEWVNYNAIMQFKDANLRHHHSLNNRKSYNDVIHMETARLVTPSNPVTNNSSTASNLKSAANKSNTETICVQPVNFNKICESAGIDTPATQTAQNHPNLSSANSYSSYLGGQFSYTPPAVSGLKNNTSNNNTQPIGNRLKYLQDRTPEIILTNMTLNPGENTYKVDLSLGMNSFKTGNRYQLELITISVGPYTFIQDKLEPLFGFDYISKPHEITLEKNFTPVYGNIPMLEDSCSQNSQTQDSQRDTIKEEDDNEQYFSANNMNKSLFTSFVHSIKLKVQLGSISNSKGVIIKLSFHPIELVPVFPQDTITSSYITRNNQQLESDVDFLVKNDDHDKATFYLIEKVRDIDLGSGYTGLV